MTDHEHIDYGNITFEKFNELVDNAEDHSCGFCFSFSHYRHLTETPRKMIWLGMTNQEEARIELLANELNRLKSTPINDTIYSYILQAECIKTQNITNHTVIAQAILDRAHEMVRKQMPSAWVAVRAFGWIGNVNLSLLPEFLDETDDLTVWQVVFQCMTDWNMERVYLKYCRDKVYEYTLKAINMDYDTMPYVVSVNGIQALMRLKDDRALELFDKLPVKKSLMKNIEDQAFILIQTLKKDRQTQYVPVLMEILSKAVKRRQGLTV